MSGPCRRFLLALTLAALVPPGTAAASFTQEPGSPFDVGLHPHAVLPADFDLDGDVDVATVDSTASTVSVLLRQPGGGFAEETGSPITIGTGPNEGGIGDFNGDGRPDIAISNFVSDNVSILIRRAEGGFEPTLVPGVTDPTAIAVANFGGDSRSDWAVAHNPAGPDSIVVSLRTGTGTWGADTGPSAPSGGTPLDIEAADFNGDGRPDLAISNDGPSTVTILIRQAAGGFLQEGPPISVPGRPWGVAAGDLNGDGRPDLAIANYNSDRVTVLLRGIGGFTPAPGSPFAVGDGPVGVAIGDFNSDGARDVAVANNTASSVTVLLRSGTGFVVEGGAAIPTDDGAFGVAVTDFNADTRPDLAISNDGGSSVTILLNTTPFPAPPPPPPPPPPPNLDVDGDGVQRPTDCDDNNAAIRPGARDRPGDKIDQDCDGRDAPYPLLRRTITAFLTTYPSGGYAKFDSMTVKPVRKGDRLRLTCRGRGCPLKKKTIRVRKNRSKQSLMRHLRGAKLRRGAVVQLRVTRRRTIGRVGTWTVRAPKNATIKHRCLRPGAKRLSRCPS